MRRCISLPGPIVVLLCALGLCLATDQLWGQATGGSTSAAGGDRAAPSKSDDLQALLRAAAQMQQDTAAQRQQLGEMQGYLSKKGSATANTPPQATVTPPTLPATPSQPPSAVMLPPAVAARAQEQFHNAALTLDYADQAFERAKQAKDPTVALVELRDGMSKLRQAQEFANRVRSVVNPPPVEVQSVAPQQGTNASVMVPPRRALTYGASTALAEAQGIDLTRGADVRTRAFENAGLSQPAEPVKLDPARGILTTNTGGQVDVRALITAADKLPGNAGTNLFQTSQTSRGPVVRIDPKALEALNDPQNQAELERIGGVSLQVTLDLLSHYGVPEFRRRGPVTVVESPVLLSLHNLLTAVRPFADTPQHWEQLPEELRYPGSIERVHGFVLDDEREDVLFVCSAAKDAARRIDIDCLILGLRTSWRDKVTPTVSLDPLPGRAEGPQYSRVEEVPIDTTFARIMLEADYAMKRITFGELDVGVPGFREINVEKAKDLEARNAEAASRFWLSPIPLGPQDLHVSPTYRTLLFESGVRSQTEAEFAGQWSGEANTFDQQKADLFTSSYAQFESSAVIEPAGIYLRLHGLVDIVTAGKILHDLRIGYQTLQQFVKLPVLTLRGAEATPRSYPGLAVSVRSYPGVDLETTPARRIIGGADLKIRAGRRSLDLYQDLTTMTLERASDEFRQKSSVAERLDFTFALPRAKDASGSRIDLLMLKGLRSYAAKDYQSARECFQAVTRDDPFYAEAWSDLAASECMLGNHQQARLDMAEAVRLEPDDESLLEREVFVLGQAFSAKASVVGEALAKREEKSTLHYLSMRLADMALSNLERRMPGKQVREYLTFALELWKENPLAWYVRSLSWGDDSDPNASGDRQMAIGYERERVLNGEAEPEFLSFLLASDVIARLKLMQELLPGPFTSWKQDHKVVQETLDELDEILADARDAELFDDASGLSVSLIAQATAVRANLRMALGKPPEIEAALAAANDAVKRFPLVPDAHLARAMAIGMQGRALAGTAGADRRQLDELQVQLQHELDEAVRLDPSYGAAYLMRAGMYAAFGPGEKALEDLRQAKRLLPKLDARLEASVRNMAAAAPSVRKVQPTPRQEPPSAPLSATDRRKAAETIARLDLVKRALREYMNDHPAYPVSGIDNLAKELGPQGAAVLSLAPDQRDPQGRILDAWRRPLVYRRTDDGGFRMYSVGPDGHDDDGAGDDIQLPDK